jgi:hypothetical protein
MRGFRPRWQFQKRLLAFAQGFARAGNFREDSLHLRKDFARAGNFREDCRRHCCFSDSTQDIDDNTGGAAVFSDSTQGIDDNTGCAFVFSTNIISKLETGSRIWVNWKNNCLYKAMVKKLIQDSDMLKIHYDGKKVNSVDTIPVDMGKSFIDDITESSWPLSSGYELSGTPLSNLREILSSDPSNFFV